MSRDVHSCSHWLRPRNPPPPLPLSPHLRSYTRGAIGPLRWTTSPCNPLVMGVPQDLQPLQAHITPCLMLNVLMGLQGEVMLEHHLAEPAGELNPALCEEGAGKLLVLPLKMTLQRALRAETSLALPVLVMEKILQKMVLWTRNDVLWARIIHSKSFRINIRGSGQTNCAVTFRNIPEIVFLNKSKQLLPVTLIMTLVVSTALRYRNFALTPLSSHLVYSHPLFLYRFFMPLLPPSENP
jgi:hypothetical protein